VNIPQLQTKLAALPNKLVDEIVLLRLANGALAIIRKRVLDGQYLEGSSPNAGEYSTTPMPLPFGKLQATVRKKLSKEELENKDKYVIFTAKSGNVWISVQGGYKAYRQMAGKFNDHVILSWSGRLMRNMGIVQKEKDSYSVGFSDPDVERIARYHTLEGAGKSHRKHVFFDLSEEERARLTKYAGEELTKEFIKAFK